MARVCRCGCTAAIKDVAFHPTKRPMSELIDLRVLARPERFELPTTKFVAWYSIQLSYGRMERSPRHARRGPALFRSGGSPSSIVDEVVLLQRTLHQQRRAVGGQSAVVFDYIDGCRDHRWSRAQPCRNRIAPPRRAAFHHAAFHGRAFPSSTGWSPRAFISFVRSSPSVIDRS